MGKKTNDIARPSVAATRSRTARAKPTVTAKALAAKPAASRAKAPAAPSKPAKKPAPKSTRPPADDYSESDVALRAYFIAENRQQAGLPGDPHQDWIEAERQLAAEAGKRKSSRAKKA